MFHNLSFERQKLTFHSNSCKNSLVVPRLETLQDVSKLVLEALISHLRTTLSLGNVDLPAPLHHGKSVMIVAAVVMIRVMLPHLEVLLLGLEIAVVEAKVAVEIPTMVAVKMATMLLQPDHLPVTQLHGLNKLLLTQLQLVMVLLAILRLAMVVDTHINKQWVLHLDLPLLPD
jgi:hypothetical protein